MYVHAGVVSAATAILLDMEEKGLLKARGVEALTVMDGGCPAEGALFSAVQGRDRASCPRSAQELLAAAKRRALLNRLSTRQSGEGAPGSQTMVRDGVPLPGGRPEEARNGAWISGTDDRGWGQGLGASAVPSTSGQVLWHGSCTAHPCASCTGWTRPYAPLQGVGSWRRSSPSTACARCCVRRADGP